MTSDTALNALFGIPSPLVDPVCGNVGEVGEILGLALAGNSVSVASQKLLDLVFEACGYFPLPTSSTVCSLDTEIDALITRAVAASGITPSLPSLPLGVLIDTTREIQSALSVFTGKPFPVDLAAKLATAAGCTQSGS